MAEALARDDVAAVGARLEARWQRRLPAVLPGDLPTVT